jgi:hypothetical protein
MRAETPPFSLSPFLEQQGFRLVGDGGYNGFEIVGYEKVLLGTE